MALLRLSSRAKGILQRIARSNADGRLVRRAQILLEVHADANIQQIAKRFGRSRQAIYKLVRRYQARRALPVAERMRDQPRPGRPGTKRERTVAIVRELLAQSPSRYHYRSPVWTVPMLRCQVQRRLRGSVHARTIRRALHQLRYRFKRPRLVFAQRSKTWRQAKGGSKMA
jgi:transposase